MIQGRRVVVTGVGLTTPLGNSLPQLMLQLIEGRSSSRVMPEWFATPLKTKVASIVTEFDGKTIPRQLRRSMGRVAQLAYDASRKAIEDSGLGMQEIQNDRTGVSYGSTMGGTDAIAQFFESCATPTAPDAVLSSTFLQIMSHTCASNLVVAFQIPGRVMASCVACAASTQAIGFAFEAIKFGKLDRVVCGGAEEMHVSVARVFDSLMATSSKFNETPKLTPRPFSHNRDGLVVGEGAGTFLLEEWNAARARGAKIYAEVIGFHTNADGNHMTNPSVDGMEKVMRGALMDAGLNPEDIAYVNAHATGTSVGDIAESQAIKRVFGNKIPVSGLKGHFGHLMGACGVVESAACLGMMEKNVLIPTLHLDEVDPLCADVYYLKKVTQPLECKYMIKNSFAFGGINASIIYKKVGN